MDYEYTLPTTGAYFFFSCYRESGQGSGLLAAASNLRAQLRDVLKRSKRSDDKDTLTVIKTIEDYLPLLFRIYQSRTAPQDRSAEPGGDGNTPVVVEERPIVTSWRSTFFDHRVPGRAFPRVDLPGIEAEVTFVLLTYAYALSNHARLPGLAPIKATELLCKAAGIFHYHNTQLTSDHGSSCSTATTATRRQCPELYPELTACLASFTLGNAQMQSLGQLERKTSAFSILCRVAVGAADHYSAAIGILSSHPMSKHIPSDFRDTLIASSRLALSRAYRYLGMERESAGHVGFAIACAVHAESLFKDTETADLCRRWTKQNRQVTFQSVPSAAEVQMQIPSGREFVKMTPFTPPTTTTTSAREGGGSREDGYAGAGGYY